MSETDGVDETFDQTMHLALTAAARAGETVARMREESQRRDATRADSERAQLEVRLAAEQQASVARLDVVRDPQWWDKASCKDVVATWQLAHTWREDPAAGRAIDRMREEVKTRYGADVGTDSDGRQVDGLLQQASADRYRSNEERNRAQQEQAEAHRIVAQADHADASQDPPTKRAVTDGLPRVESAVEKRTDKESWAEDEKPEVDVIEDAEIERDAARQLRECLAAAPAADVSPFSPSESGRASALYDSAERREIRAHQLERAGVDSETVAGVLRADTGQGRPATDAVRPRNGKAPRARVNRSAPGAAAKVEPSR